MSKFLARHFYRLFCAALIAFSTHAVAVHLDVEVWAENDTIQAGFCRTPGAVGCDLTQLVASLNLPANTLPVEGATNQMIFLADFRDFSGGLFKTPNPGFQAVANALNPGELLRYKAIGHLEYWDSLNRSWGPAPSNVRVKLAGAIDPALVITNSAQCGGQLFCFAPSAGSLDGATLFTGTGIAGKAEMIIDAANPQGSLHTHLNFFLENSAGALGGPVGAYLLQLQALSTERSQASQPFFVLFNAGLPATDFSEALLARVNTLPPTPPPALLPVANAGKDQIVRLNSTVKLDAGASHDPQPGPAALTFAWQQSAGSGVTLIGASTATPSFVPTQPGNFSFKLSVSDGANTGFDEVTYSVPALGDVDLDGDIDRIDVALILVAASKTPQTLDNDVRDIDANRLINSTDARLAQARCTLRRCYPTSR